MDTGIELATVYEHFPESFPALLKLLKPTLPYCLPLFRRIQFALKHNVVQIFATFPPDSERTVLPKHYTIALFDPNSPGIQAWLFCSLELEADELQNLIGEDKTYQVYLPQLLSIVATLRENSPNSNEQIIKVGSVRSCIANLLRSETDLVRDDLAGPGGPYGKYIFQVPEIESDPTFALPEGLYFDDNIRPSDHELIIATNDLISSASSLLVLPYGIGIRSQATEKLVAWAFIGLDGCVRTLYVVPEYRRLGLGRIVAAKAAIACLRIFNQSWSSSKDNFAFADADSENRGSVQLFKNLGAQWFWESYWIRIDLDRLHSG